MATSARNWKKPENTELELPSGNTCLVRRIGMEKLLAAGVLPDSLTPIAMEAVNSARSGGKPQDHKKKGEQNELDPEIMKRFMEKEGALEDIFLSFDKVTVMCVVEPEVRLHLIQELDDNGVPRKDVNGRTIWKEIPQKDREPRDEGGNVIERDWLWADEVDSDDKQFIFQFVAGGTRDLEQFRNSGDDVAAL